MVTRLSKENREAGTSYATVRDYCESVDLLPEITPTDGDLKNVQRPWALKAFLHADERRPRNSLPGGQAR